MTAAPPEQLALPALRGVPTAQLALHLRGHGAGTSTGVAAGTAFPLGSLTKPVTAALVVLLADDGDLDLDAPLPGGWTARQLLTHTSGLASNVDEDADQPGERAAFAARRAAAPVHPPGAVFSYSNIGYTALGALVEDITGLTWEQAVADVVLRPLRITPAFTAGPDTGRPVAVGHAGGRVVPEQSLRRVEAPCAGLALSAADLVAFARHCLRELPGMFADQLGGVAVGPHGMADGWGLGWARYGDWFGHDGTGDGTSCHLRVHPGTGDAVALTTGSSTGRVLWEDVLAQLDVPVGDCAAPPPPDRPGRGPDACVGRFANGDNDFTVLRRPDGRLALATGDVLEFHDELRFALAGPVRLAGRFLRDPRTGEVDLLQVSGRLARRTHR